ncbi:hypothetical protein GZ78_27965 [Endozoicomonas numazuensis]|uniref:Uncharacterized protein n=2 Tax=Endozoicomonas numazuensis TaxID=1137799 RepID=A0A081N1D9_9GAMM|nr:hypothetical protein GZ78_27965 [Endozoicomonas numazuensis]
MGDSHSGYMLISTSECGRKVYIRGDVAKDFAGLVTGSAFKGQRVVSRLIQLRANAGGMQSFSNLNSAFEHMDIVENLQIGYKILQTSRNQPGGVYITSIGFVEQNAEEVGSGLYKVDYIKGPNKWRLDTEAKPSITTKNAAINGLCKTAKVAAQDIMPEIVTGANQNDRGKQFILDDGYTLYYNPRSFYSRKKVWKTPQQKQNCFEFAANQLGNVLLNAQYRQQKIQWTVHGDGSRLLKRALMRLQGQNLDGHTVFFAAPTEWMAGLLPLMRKCGMKLHDEVMAFNADDWRAPGNRLDPRIITEIQSFGPAYRQAAQKYKQAMQSDMITAFGWGTLASTPLTGSFIDSLMDGQFLDTMGPRETAGVLGGISLAVARRGRSLRNMTANRANDPALNPHMHPFKSASSFNAHVAQGNGGEFKSFLAICKSLGKEYA